MLEIVKFILSPVYGNTVLIDTVDCVRDLGVNVMHVLSFASPLAAVYFGGTFDGSESNKRCDAIPLVVDLNVF